MTYTVIYNSTSIWCSYVRFTWVDKPKWLWRDCSLTVNFSRGCLKLIPHEKFSFAKLWLLAAQFEIRQLNLKAARQILGNAIGKAPKDKVIYWLSLNMYYIWHISHILTLVILLFNPIDIQEVYWDRASAWKYRPWPKALWQVFGVGAWKLLCMEQVCGVREIFVWDWAS